jgi:hypothetical protein
MKRLSISNESHRRSRTIRRTGSRRRLLRGVELLETRRMLAAVSWTGAGDGTSWTNSANWSTHALSDFSQLSDDLLAAVGHVGFFLAWWKCNTNAGPEGNNL